MGAHVFSTKFSPDGELLASCSFDKGIFLWNVYGNCENIASMKGHAGPVLDLCWGRDGETVFTASSDKTGAVFDVETGTRIKRFRGHAAVVNSIVGARRGDPLVATGSDDCTAMLWDLRMKNHTHSLPGEYQITSVALSDDSTQIFTGGIEEDVKCFDIRTGRLMYSLLGHRDSVTGMELSPDGNFLLTNGMDNTLHMWDVRQFVIGNNRLISAFTGHQHDFQQNLLKCGWSPDGTKVTAGSADRFVYIWDVRSKRILYKLPGHSGVVSEVDFHPKEPIIVSCSSDKTIILGEIEY